MTMYIQQCSPLGKAYPIAISQLRDREGANLCCYYTARPWPEAVPQAQLRCPALLQWSSYLIQGGGFGLPSVHRQIL